MIQLTIEDDLKLTGSEQLTLATRGYKMIKKVNEGSYAKVHLTPFQSSYLINAIQLILRDVPTGLSRRIQKSQ